MWAAGLCSEFPLFLEHPAMKLLEFFSSAGAFDAGHSQRQDIKADDARDPPWKLLPFLRLERS